MLLLPVEHWSPFAKDKRCHYSMRTTSPSCGRSKQLHQRMHFPPVPSNPSHNPSPNPFIISSLHCSHWTFTLIMDWKSWHCIFSRIFPWQLLAHNIYGPWNSQRSQSPPRWWTRTWHVKMNNTSQGVYSKVMMFAKQEVKSCHFLLTPQAYCQLLHDRENTDRKITGFVFSSFLLLTLCIESIVRFFQSCSLVMFFFLQKRHLYTP